MPTVRPAQSARTRAIHRRATLIEVAAALTLATVVGVAATRPAVLAVLAIYAALAAGAVGVAWLADVLYRRLSYRLLLAVSAVAVLAVALAVRVRAVDWGRLVAAAPVSVVSPSGWMVVAAALIVVAVAVVAVVSNLPGGRVGRSARWDSARRSHPRADMRAVLEHAAHRSPGIPTCELERNSS